jgi:F-type H+-transporting ATPase subunit epsilon
MPVALEIVSPEKLLLSRDVDMVVVPAAEGDLGVLPNHAPMIALLRGGTISLYAGAQVTDRLFVSGGFVEVTPERCTVLADRALPLAEVSRAAAEKLLAEAEAAYNDADKMDIAAIDAAMDRLQAARAMLAVAEAA